jgi:hypothetical protein
MANLQASSFTDLTLPSGTTAERPASPTLGMVRYNTTISLLEYYDGTNWRPVTGYSAGTIGSGGTITKVNNNIVHTFTSVGSATFTPSFTGYVQVLVVAGGAGPAGGWGGGGGGGGMLFNRAFPVSAGTAYPLTVGNGGARGTQANGGNSAFSTITANGGGHAGTWDQQTPGNPGGSGGGGANTSIDGSRLRVFGGLGITGQGFPGGSGVRFNDDGENTHNGGGGGGAGGPGWASQDENQQQATHGGPGAASDILGDILYWGGGGASGPHICDGGGGDGGIGGGGGGAAHYVPGFPRVGNGHGGGQALNKGQPATNNDGHARYGGDGGANTGGGGGNGGSTHGGGGSGIVVVRY